MKDFRGKLAKWANTLLNKISFSFVLLKPIPAWPGDRHRFGHQKIL